MSNYAISRKVNLPYAEAVERVRESLKEEGFGVITEIDVRKTLQEKLGEEFRPYVILGACNPRLAHQSLSAVLDIGLLMPCNVCVWDNEDGTSTVSAVDVEALFKLVDDACLKEAAQTVRAALARAIGNAGPAAECCTT